MKTCPHCDTRYSDDTLQFCLQDGTPLLAPDARHTPTVVLAEDETVTRGGGVQWPPSQVTHVSTRTAQAKGSRTAIAVAITVVAMLVLFGFVGVAAWLLLGNGREIASNASTINANRPGGGPTTNLTPTSTANVLQATPLPTNADLRTPAPPVNAQTPPPQTDDAVSRNEVTQRIHDWKSLLEARDLNGYMDNYAPTVDYYRRSGASMAAVRADKARAFTLYNSMRVNITNMSVSVGPSGETATATFDKEWSFSGRDTSSGKVRSQLGLRRINGRWLITSERDLRVYYTR